MCVEVDAIIRADGTITEIYVTDYNPNDRSDAKENRALDGQSFLHMHPNMGMINGDDIVTQGEKVDGWVFANVGQGMMDAWNSENHDSADSVFAGAALRNRFYDGVEWVENTKHFLFIGEVPMKYYILLFLYFGCVAHVSATEDCKNLSLAGSFALSDATVMATPLSATPDFDQMYKNYVGVIGASEYRALYDKYLTEFPANIFLVQYVYKGSLEVGQEIRVANNIEKFMPGNDYVLLLVMADHVEGQIRQNFVVDRCVYVDVSKNEIIWNGYLKDKANYPYFMNQLMYMKEFGRAPSVIPDISSP